MCTYVHTIMFLAITNSAAPLQWEKKKTTHKKFGETYIWKICDFMWSLTCSPGLKSVPRTYKF